MPGVEILQPLEANEVFVRLPDSVIASFAGTEYDYIAMGGRNSVRLVASFNTTDEQVDGLCALAGGQGAERKG